MDYFYANSVLRGEVSGFNSGSNSFTNIFGRQFVVNQNQILTDSTKYASNGYIYTLNDFTLPDSVYRRSFVFRAEPQIPDPVNPSVTIPNPGIVYGPGVENPPEEVINTKAYGGKYTEFNFLSFGAELDIIMPLVTKGYYKASLKVLLVAGGTGILDAYYGTTRLLRFSSTATLPVGTATMGLSNNRIGTIPLGVINVPNTGTVKFAFVIVDKPWDPNSATAMAFPFYQRLYWNRYMRRDDVRHGSFCYLK